MNKSTLEKIGIILMIPFILTLIIMIVSFLYEVIIALWNLANMASFDELCVSGFMIMFVIGFILILVMSWND